MNGVFPQPYQPLMLGLMVTGLIAWAAGYRLFRLVLTLIGFMAGAWAATQVFGASDRALLLFAELGGGALGALIMFLGYFVGVALVGAGIGALAVHMFWSRLGTDPHPVVVILASVAGAASAMALQRYVSIIGTAFTGAWMMLLSGSMLSERGQKALKPSDVWILYPLDLTSSSRSVVIAWAVLGFAGILIQLRFTGRTVPRVKNKKKSVTAGV